jgi:hypothetical protein
MPCENIPAVEDDDAIRETVKTALELGWAAKVTRKPLAIDELPDPVNGYCPSGRAA